MSSGVRPPGRPVITGRARLRSAMHPRLTRNQVAAGVLCGLLGFAAAVQVRANATDSLLRVAREPDLIRILDDVTERSQRLSAESRDLEITRDELRSGGNSRAAALAEVRRRAGALGILAGTRAAQGPGVKLVILDPRRRVTAPVLLDALEELRDAGAEAVQLGGVRVVAQTYLLDEGPGRVKVDGTVLQPPYDFTVIGDPRTLAAALAIPGGVLASLHDQGARGVLTQQDRLTVSALRTLRPPRYARPAPATPSPG
jgi:uncharacterized protein YlxW (UPF0749 family)